MPPAAAAVGTALGPPPYCQKQGQELRDLKGRKKRGCDAKGGIGVPLPLKAALPPWHWQDSPSSFPCPAWLQEGRAHRGAPSTGSGCNRTGVRGPHLSLARAGGRGAGRRRLLPRRRQHSTNVQVAAPAPPTQQLVLSPEPVREQRELPLALLLGQSWVGDRWQLLPGMWGRG